MSKGEREREREVNYPLAACPDEFYCTSITFLILPLSCACGVAPVGMQSASVTTKKECTADGGGGRRAAGRGHAFFLMLFFVVTLALCMPTAVHGFSCKWLTGTGSSR